MAIQTYIHGEDFKKLIDDKLVNSNGVKYVMKQKGILPVCTSAENLSDLVYRILFGSCTMSKIHDIMNFEQNNLKSTMVVISPKSKEPTNDFLTDIADEFVKKQRIPATNYILKNIRRNDNSVALQYSFQKPQKGRVSLADSRTITLDVQISPLPENQYKVSIRHEGISESKQFISFLDDMVNIDADQQVFGIRRITLDSLQKTNKVDFFDQFGSHKHTDWILIDITNVTVNNDISSIDEDDDDTVTQELSENESTGKLSGISSAILSGGGLRNNDFVKECMSQGFIFSSMRYKLKHKHQPITLEIDVNFKQKDLKINIFKTYELEDDGKDHITSLPSSDQSIYIDYFQNIAYKIYNALIKKQRSQVVIKSAKI